MSRSDRDLERIALGELPADDLTEGERERLEALRASNEAILAHYPPAGVKTEVERRLAAEAPRRRSGVWPVVSVLAAAAAVVVVVARPDAPTERTKGDAHLVVHEKTAQGVRPVREGDVLGAGALLQVGYSAGGAGYGAVFSIDGRDTVTLHWPRDASTPSPTIEPDGDSLPVSYELDDAPRFERFFLVTCDARFDVQDVLRAAEALTPAETGTLEVDDDCRTDTLRLEKATP